MVSKKIVSQSVTIMACALAAFLIGASMVTIHTDDKKMAQNNASTVRVYAVEPYQVKPGEPITIIGQGFEVSNTVHFGDMLFTNVPAQDTQTIVLATTSALLPLGTYSIAVENTKGRSSDVKGARTIEIKVTNTVTAAPTVVSIDKTEVRVGDQITITGSNFTSTGNYVKSVYGTAQNIDSVDGTHITFSVEYIAPKVFLDRETIGSTVKKLPMTVYVSNTNGVSKAIQFNIIQ